jgi:hypothetical protein
MLEFAGVTAIDTSVGVTVRVVEPEMLPDMAFIIVLPTDTDEASPLEPAVLLIVATDTFDELHVTDVVRFCVELSEKVPVAVNCWVVPRGMLGFAGVTAIDTSVGEIGGGLIVMFSTVTVPLLIVSVPAIAEFELSVEKLLV